MFDCDFCNSTFDNRDKWYALVKRPSCPEEIVAVLWACPECGKENGLTGPEGISALETQFEEKGYAEFGGRHCLFLSI